MNCGNEGQKTSDCNCNNRSMNMNDRSMHCEKNNCTNMRTVNNMNRNMNRNTNNMGYGMNRSTNSNMSCGMNRNTNSNMGCGMNRNTNNNMGYRANKNMNNEMNRNTDCGKSKEKNENCYGGCDRGNEPVDEMMPAMAFVPWQKWKDVYCIEEGLENGTIFAQLNKPLIGRPLK